MRRRTFLGLLGCAFVAAGCSNPSPPSRPSTGAPPVIFCGKTLYAGAEGLPIYRPPLAKGTYVNPMDPQVGATPLLVQTADNCSHGSHIQITPPGLVAVTVEIDARDRSPVAVSLKGVQPGRGTLVVTGSDVHGSVPLVVVDPAGRPGEPTNGQTVP